MAWNIGANDVANAMGTSVGSGALTLAKAVIIAGVLEFCGAFFLGSNVSQTMQKGLVNPDLFSADPNIFLFGMLAALLATAVWLQVASYFGWPVSTTHAIVGAILGFGVLIGGVQTVNWGIVGSIALSWVISPALSALISYAIFSILQKKILFAMSPAQAARRLIPLLIFIVFATFTLSFASGGLQHLHLKFTFMETALLALVVGLIAALIAFLIIRSTHLPERYTKTPSVHLSAHVISLNKAIKHLQRVKISSKGETREEVSKLLKETKILADDLREKTDFYSHTSDYQVVEKMFVYLQILSAGYVAFAHGANDVANAIGPVAGALEIIKHHTVAFQSTIPTWLLVFGGVGIVIGLATWGWRVIETIGRKITELTPTRGFSAEFGAASTILIASKLGLPVSTTHCIVGAVLGVGLARGLSAINLRMLRDIGLSWIITIPSSAIVCIIFFHILHAIFTPFMG